MSASDILAQLEATLEARKSATPEASYVASLYGKGLNGILAKVGEEAVELVLAAREAENLGGDSRKAVVAETADLWFHCMVMLCQLGLSHGEVLAELQKRFKMSGHEEKSSRKQ